MGINEQRQGRLLTRLGSKRILNHLNYVHDSQADMTHGRKGMRNSVKRKTLVLRV